MTPEQKAWIDSANYDVLLSHWRFARCGDSMFQGETGDYYKAVMARKRQDVGDAGHTAASKRIGWDPSR